MTIRFSALLLSGALLFPHAAIATDEPSTSVTTHGAVVTHQTTLEQYVQLVEKHWPLMRVAELDQTVAEADILSAEGGFDLSWKTKGTVRPVGYYQAVQVESLVEKPTGIWGASAFAGWRLGTGDFAVYDGKKQTLEYGEILAGVNVPLWKDGPIDERRAKLKTAQIGKRLAALSVQQQRIALRRVAAHRYWDWVAAGRYHTIASRLLSNVEERNKGLRERVARGDLAQVELTDNARAIAQRQNQVASARRALKQAFIELTLLVPGANTNVQMLAADALPADFPEIETHSSTTVSDIKRAQMKRPELAQLSLKLEQNQIETRWAKNQAAPGVDLRVMGSKDIGSEIESRPDLADGVLEVSLLLDVPLQRRKMKGKAQSAAARASQLRLKQGLTKTTISAEIRSTEAAIEAALTGLDAARQEVALTIELEKAERVRFQGGASHLLIVNLREQQTAEAELRESTAYRDYYRALADLRAAQGH